MPRFLPIGGELRKPDGGLFSLIPCRAIYLSYETRNRRKAHSLTAFVPPTCASHFSQLRFALRLNFSFYTVRARVQRESFFGIRSSIFRCPINRNKRLPCDRILTNDIIRRMYGKSRCSIHLCITARGKFLWRRRCGGSAVRERASMNKTASPLSQVRFCSSLSRSAQIFSRLTRVLLCRFLCDEARSFFFFLSRRLHFAKMINTSATRITRPVRKHALTQAPPNVDCATVAHRARTVRRLKALPNHSIGTTQVYLRTNQGIDPHRDCQSRNVHDQYVSRRTSLSVTRCRRSFRKLVCLVSKTRIFGDSKAFRARKNADYFDQYYMIIYGGSQDKS